MSEKGREKLRKHILWYLAESGAKPTVALVVDAMVPPTEFDQEAVRVCENEQHPYVVIANKCDRLNQKERSLAIKQLSEAFPGATIIPHSAKTGEGKSEVRTALGLV
jgi:GTP-binding protein EngB required for normal cell division